MDFRPRNYRTILIMGWIIWASIAVACLSNVLPNLIGLLLAAVIWLILVIATLVDRRRSILITGMTATLAAGIALITDWDLAVRIALSQSSLQQAADDVDNVQSSHEARRIGLFNVRYVDRYQHATLFATQAVFLEDYGIAFVPNGQPPADISGAYRFWRIYGNWFGYEWDG